MADLLMAHARERKFRPKSESIPASNGLGHGTATRALPAKPFGRPGRFDPAGAELPRYAVSSLAAFQNPPHSAG